LCGDGWPEWTHCPKAREIVPCLVRLWRGPKRSEALPRGQIWATIFRYRKTPCGNRGLLSNAERAAIVERMNTGTASKADWDAWSRALFHVSPQV
jgi:hypothetical protein